MKTKLVIYVCLFFSAVMLYSCGSDDLVLKKKIELELSTNYPSIGVEALNGTVTLTGTVNSEEEKSKIGDIVDKMKYVKVVSNKIYVREPEPVVVETPDEALTKVVSAALKAGGYEAVTATIKDSVITLTGNVKKADVKKIIQIANDAKPKKVVNQLKTK